MIEKFKTWLDDNSITEVECLVPDLGGIARGKILPTNKFLKGLEDDSHRLPQSTFIQTISGDYAYEDSTGTLPKSIYNPTDVDVILKPDFNSMRVVPWYEDPTAQVICDAVNLNGDEVINSSRNALKNILKLYKKENLLPIVSPELEFYLVKPNPDAPNINSFRRLFATWGTPKNVKWGIGNRSCGFRIPSIEEKNMRIENRIPGSDTNPYLVFAANLASGYLGMKNNIKPTSETKDSAFLASG